jgi:hypothetical protein
MRPAINVSRHQKPVPVHRRVDVKCILDRDLYFIAAAQSDDRSEDGSRIAIGPCRLALEERMPSGCNLQFDRISLFGRIDQRRDRQTPVEVYRLTSREAAADETPEEAARHRRG